MLGVGLAAAAVGLAAAFIVLSRRGVLRWLALAAFVLAPIAVYAFAALLWVAAVAVSRPLALLGAVAPRAVHALALWPPAAVLAVLWATALACF